MKSSAYVKLFALLLGVFSLKVVAQSPNWTATGNLTAARYHHTATLLANGKVVIAGGFSSCNFPAGCTTLDSAELYDPAAGTWTATGKMKTVRSAHKLVGKINLA